MNKAQAPHNQLVPDIRDALSYMPEAPQDTQCFQEISAVLERYGFQDRFGICLLHKHFAVFSEEVMVESCDEEARTLTIAPVLRDLIPDQSNLKQTSWRLSGGGPIPEVSCETYCYKKTNGKHDWAHKKER